MSDSTQYSRFRERSRGSISPQGEALYQNYTMGSPAVYTPIATGKTEVMKDWVTPGWHQKKRLKQPVFHPMVKETQICESKTTSLWSGYQTGYPWTWDKQVSGDWSFSILQDSNPYVPISDMLDFGHPEFEALFTEVGTKCLSSIGRSSANSWETLAEIRKTVGMFRHPIDTFWKWYRKSGVAYHVSRNTVDGYLAWRYGLSPLIRDAGSILENLNRGVRPIWETTRAKGNYSFDTITDSSWTNGVHTVNLRTHKTQGVSVRCMSLDEVKADLATDLGFEGKSLLTLGWELVPYSFVADWIVNVGDYIGAIAQSFRSGNLGSCTVVDRETKIHKFSTSHTVASSWTMTSPSAAETTKTRIIRDRSLGLPSPRLVIKSDFRFDDATRIADALSLIGQQVLRIGSSLRS